MLFRSQKYVPQAHVRLAARRQTEEEVEAAPSLAWGEAEEKGLVFVLDVFFWRDELDRCSE